MTYQVFPRCPRPSPLFTMFSLFREPGPCTISLTHLSLHFCSTSVLLGLTRSHHFPEALPDSSGWNSVSLPSPPRTCDYLNHNRPCPSGRTSPPWKAGLGVGLLGQAPSLSQLESIQKTLCGPQETDSRAQGSGSENRL